MKKISHLLNIVKSDPKVIVIWLLYKTSPLLPDKLYLKLLFPLSVGYPLNLETPRTFNEKLQWLKLNYRKPIMTKMVDKYEAKKFISNKIGKEYVVENYGIWDNFESINFNSLPNSFVLKTTHDQGGVVICRDKGKLELENAQKKLTKHLKFRHYYLTREWPYKNVKPRILAEKLLESDDEFKDYKFYCFNGIPKVMYISQGKKNGKLQLDYFDMNFNQLDIRRPNIESSGKELEKPQQFELMRSLSSKLSEGFPHLRVDFYQVENKLYVGELTFFQGGGMMPFIPEKWDNTFGNWIELPI